jgi:1-deoxy-D-xylulose-5-phosphate reductoisomerase
MIGVALLGATGSIGASALAVMRQHRGRFRLAAIAARSDWEGLLAIIHEFEPDVCAVEDTAAAMALRDALSRHRSSVRLEIGPDAVTAVAQTASADIVIAGISGFAGLPSTWAAVSAGKQLLLANKEALVASGQLLLSRAKLSGARILPIDSEHNAVFQCANGIVCDPAAVRSITLTASGGPFRTRALDTFDSITVAEACKHPTWDMGRKISVDSATLMNKGLEVIEAALLFGRPARDIRVLIHPSSTVHAMVEYVDGSVLAHLGPTDMQVPIAHALAKAAANLGQPIERLTLALPSLSLPSLSGLQFFEVDNSRFPALELAYQALNQGQGACLALNAANEVAVSAFLSGGIRFIDIVALVDETLQVVDTTDPASMEEVFAQDARVRAHVMALLPERVVI